LSLGLGFRAAVRSLRFAAVCAAVWRGFRGAAGGRAPTVVSPLSLRVTARLPWVGFGVGFG